MKVRAQTHNDNDRISGRITEEVGLESLVHILTKMRWDSRLGRKIVDSLGRSSHGGFGALHCRENGALDGGAKGVHDYFSWWK